MTRRLPALLFLCAIALAACREERAELAPKTEDLLRDKADAKVAEIARHPGALSFAAVVVFSGDVFIHQSALLDRHGISLLDSFDNVAILLLDPRVIPPLLAEKSVRKVRYFSRQGPLARFHPAFLLSLLRIYGAGKEEEPVDFFATFRSIPSDGEVKAVQNAGFTVRSRDGAILSLQGPTAAVPRLLEIDRIIYYEGASNLRTL